MTLKLNDNVKMLKDTEWWDKDDIGRIVRIDWDDSYLICFDKNCTQEHNYANGHTWWAYRNHFEPYRPNKLMTVE